MLRCCAADSWRYVGSYIMITSLNTTVKVGALFVLIVAGTLLGFAIFGPGTAAGATTFTVDSTANDSDANAGDGICATAGAVCTLQAAIQEANAFAGIDIIEFNIAGAGPHTISPVSLPHITEPVTIDGYTQPGASANTNGPGLATNAVLMIELDGSSAASGVSGLTISAGSTTIKGLVINRFGSSFGPSSTKSGILLQTGGGNTIVGNYIGSDVAGVVDLGNHHSGIYLLESASNTIGGTSPGARNIISGNGRNGLTFDGAGSTGNFIEGNYIGTDVTGASALGNTDGGISISSPFNHIGGTDLGAGNVISGNGPGSSGPASGIRVRGGSSGTTIEGNYIGTDLTGTVDLGNESDGVELSATSAIRVGGTTVGARNVISGNGAHGVEIKSSFDNVVEGNYIGVDVTGIVGLGNSNHGVHITSNAAQDNLIGGTASGAGNIISDNGGVGVIVTSSAAGNMIEGNYIGTDVTGTIDLGNTSRGVQIGPGTSGNSIGGADVDAANTIAFNGDYGVGLAASASSGNAISGNLIYSNTGLGIDLESDGVTPNDAGDGDSGPNNLQNFPVLASATSGSTNIEGSLNSTANTEFRVEFFSNTVCDVSGHGEGETYLGSTTETTNGSGDVSFSISFTTTVPVGDFITATATDPDGNTSEFSECIEVVTAKLAKPGDTDGDGCPDLHENGPDETLGGQRDWLNPNDFYDVAGSPLPPQNGAPDGVIDLPNDILGVIQHHPAGTLGYDVQFDRGTWTGPNSWNETQGPDGVIDLPNDILGVILQFAHSCV